MMQMTLVELEKELEEINNRYRKFDFGPAMSSFSDLYGTKQTLEDSLRGEANEYLIRYDHLMNSNSYGVSFEAREKMVRYYSWAIPNEAAINKLAELAPIVEMGAGGGYWSYLIRKKVGFSGVVAYDRRIEIPNFWAKRRWTHTFYGQPSKLKKHRNSTLFLCWPPYNTDMAARCLKYYQGNRLAYVGEGYGGCTGDDAFHDELEEKWNLEETIEIPQWWGVHDQLFVFRKKDLNG